MNTPSAMNTPTHRGGQLVHRHPTSQTARPQPYPSPRLVTPSSTGRGDYSFDDTNYDGGSGDNSHGGGDFPPVGTAYQSYGNLVHEGQHRRTFSAPGNLSARWIDNVLNATTLNEDLDARKQVHTFYNLNTDEKLTKLYIELLVTAAQVNTSLSKVLNFGPVLARVEELSRKSWEPSEAQEKLLRELIKHYFVKPISSYKNVLSAVQDYITKNAARLKLQVYIKDSLVKRSMNKWLTREVGEGKSQFRKLVFESVREHSPLSEFAAAMIASWHMPLQPNPIPDTILATFALHREIAGPLAHKKNSKGSDTGHWSAVEAALTKAYDENGSDRGRAEKWIQWQNEKIAADNQKYIRLPVEELVPVDGNGDGHQDEINGEDQDPNDNGDVDLRQLGDMTAFEP